MNLQIEADQKSNLPDLTKNVIESYKNLRSTHHLDQCPLPNKQKIVEMIGDLLEILYPGYLRRDRLDLNNVVYYVGELLDRVFEQMSIQISRAFCHGNKLKIECSPQKRYDFEQLGRTKAFEFLKQIPTVREMLAKDVEAAHSGDPACTSFDEVIFCYPCLVAISVYRLAHILHDLEVPLIPRIMTEWAHSQTGIDIHPGAKIGEYFFIDHGTGVVIGETCEIGDWVKLYQGVTLGAKSFPKDEKGNLKRGEKRHPTINNNVVIYANATILGGDTIVGDHSVIGSSVWLEDSVPPGSKVTIKKIDLNVK